jgi:hypothetical protein
MRDAIIIGSIILVFAGLYYGAILQDRMRRKARQPDTSIFSSGFVFRSLATKEAAYFVMLVLAMVAFGATMIAMDEAGYLPR